ncbi:MAG TPA: hypothetical protein VMW23_06955 [Sedimentisphaerales bacterium]|nr:hypothetical protein [Sedimentisphaerales bacterium]
MSKKFIIIAGAVAVTSFAGTFLFGWLTKPAPSPPPVASQPASTPIDTFAEPAQVQAAGPVQTPPSKVPSEKKLRELVYDLQQKMQDYNNNLQDLQLREQRLKVAHETLKKDINRLENLRLELASTVAALRQQQQELAKTKVDITQIEKNNLVSIAATYDKMDSSSAGKILVNISKTNTDTSNGIDEAAKILYYMSERTKAKLLAELAGSEPKLAAVLCQQLKKVVQEN